MPLHRVLAMCIVGTVLAAAGSSDVASATEMDVTYADRGISVGGRHLPRSPTGELRFATGPGWVARFTRSGKLDPTFGARGTLRVHGFVNPDTGLDRALIDGHGNVVLAVGRTVSRYGSDGHPDPSFGSHGRTLVGATLGSEAAAPDPLVVALLPTSNGSTIAISRSGASGVTVTRLDIDGRPMTTFGDQRGAVAVPLASLTAAAVLPQGDVVVAGLRCDLGSACTRSLTILDSRGHVSSVIRLGAADVRRIVPMAIGGFLFTGSTTVDLAASGSVMTTDVTAGRVGSDGSVLDRIEQERLRSPFSSGEVQDVHSNDDGSYLLAGRTDAITEGGGFLVIPVPELPVLFVMRVGADHHVDEQFGADPFARTAPQDLVAPTVDIDPSARVRIARATDRDVDLVAWSGAAPSASSASATAVRTRLRFTGDLPADGFPVISARWPRQGVVLGPRLFVRWRAVSRARPLAGIVSDTARLSTRALHGTAAIPVLDGYHCYGLQGFDSKARSFTVTARPCYTRPRSPIAFTRRTGCTLAASATSLRGRVLVCRHRGDSASIEEGCCSGRFVVVVRSCRGCGKVLIAGGGGGYRASRLIDLDSPRTGRKVVQLADGSFKGGSIRVVEPGAGGVIIEAVSLEKFS